MYNGNCECKHCGLRGTSKNVAIRSVFPRFEGRPILLASYEANIKAREDKEVPGTYLFGSIARNWEVEGDLLFSLADTLINYLQTRDAKIEDLRILLCVHEWVQDPGTATV